MADENIFDIAFEFESKSYKGWVNPSDKLDSEGKPVSFHVVLNDVSFGYMSFSSDNWTINEERPAGLIKAVGQQIEKHYPV